MASTRKEYTKEEFLELELIDQIVSQHPYCDNQYANGNSLLNYYPEIEDVVRDNRFDNVVFIEKRELAKNIAIDKTWQLIQKNKGKYYFDHGVYKKILSENI